MAENGHVSNHSSKSSSYLAIAEKLAKAERVRPVNKVGAAFYELSPKDQAIIVAEQRKGKVV